QDQGARRGSSAQASPRVPPEAGAVRPLRRGGPRLLPGEGGRDVEQVGDSGRGAVPASGQDAGGAVGEVAGSPFGSSSALVAGPGSRKGGPALSCSIGVSMQ